MPVPVSAQEIDRPDVGRVLATDDAQVLTKSTNTRRDELLQLSLYAVLGEPGVVSQRDGVIQKHLVQLDREPLAARVGGDDRVRFLTDGAGWAHPVQRLVRLGVGVDGDRPVRLEQDQPLRGREPGTEPALVLDRAPRHDQPHGPRCTTSPKLRA